MGLLKIGSFYKKNKNSQQKKSVVEPPPAPAPALPTLSLDTPTTQPVQKEQTTAGSGGLFDDILAELGSPIAAEKKGGLDDFSLALALSQQLEIKEDKKEEKKVAKVIEEKKSKTPSSFLTGDSIYSSYLKNLSALDDNKSNTPSGETSMFSSLMNDSYGNSSSTPVISTTPSTSTPTLKNHSTTLKVLDSDVSDSDESKKEEEDDEESYERMTKGMRPIMERRGNDHRLKRKVDSWTHRVDPEANRVESSESMIERMKDRHRNQVKFAAMQRQQDMQNMMMMNMVPQPYVLQSHPNNVMMDPSNNGMYSYPIQNQAIAQPHPQQEYYAPAQPQPHPQQEQHYAPAQPQEYPTSAQQQQQTKYGPHAPQNNDSDTSLYTTHTASVQSSLSSVDTASKEDVKNEECDGAEADVEISDDDESFTVTQRKKVQTKNNGPVEHRQSMRPSKSTPNLKKNKKKSATRRNSQDQNTSTPSSASDNLITPPQQPHSHQQPIRHMKSEPELINTRKRQQMHHHQQQLQFEWDRMQAYQREQQLKMMQQQQYMSMYPVMYYNQPMMMPPTNPANNPRMSHSYSFHTSR